MPPHKIAVVGAGIGGPAAAAGLARNGHDVTIYERSASSDVGYAFRITPNSDRCLRLLGIDTVAGGAVPSNIVRGVNSDGQEKSLIKENQDAEKAKEGTSVFAYRPQLAQQLIDKAIESGTKVQMGAKVVNVDLKNSTLELADGAKVSADLIIAADGVHSMVRSCIVDIAKFPTGPSTGHSAFRFMISTETARKDDVLSKFITEDARMLAFNANKKLLLVYPVDYAKQLNITCVYPEALSKGAAQGDHAAEIAYNQKVSFETAKSIHSDFDPAAQRFIELADPEGFRIWKLVDADEIPHWSSNRTVLLGDAAHPVLPFGFSGASMAIEDAATLTELLPADVESEDITERLKLYEELRKPRVGVVRDTARKMALGQDGEGGLKRYMEFLSSHNANEHAKQALSKHLQGASGA